MSVVANFEPQASYKLNLYLGTSYKVVFNIFVARPTMVRRGEIDHRSWPRCLRFSRDGSTNPEDLCERCGAQFSVQDGEVES